MGDRERKGFKTLHPLPPTHPTPTDQGVEPDVPGSRLQVGVEGVVQQRPPVPGQPVGPPGAGSTPPGRAPGAGPHRADRRPVGVDGLARPRQARRLAAQGGRHDGGGGGLRGRLPLLLW